jgi:transposase-like protein
LTLVEDGREAIAESAQESAQDGATIRRSRRPKVGLDEEREIARLYGDAGVQTSEIRARFGIGESSLYRIIQRQGVPLRGRSSSTTVPASQPAPAAQRGRRRASSGVRHVAGPLAAVAAATAGAELASATTPATRGRSARRTSVAQPRTPASPVTVRQASSNGHRFRIRYLGERVFEAQNIQDALLQAESLGASEIMAVARED